MLVPLLPKYFVHAQACITLLIQFSILYTGMHVSVYLCCHDTFYTEACIPLLLQCFIHLGMHNSAATKFSSICCYNTLYTLVCIYTCYHTLYTLEYITRLLQYFIHSGRHNVAATIQVISLRTSLGRLEYLVVSLNSLMRCHAWLLNLKQPIGPINELAISFGIIAEH